jgi:hypothetical protein
VSNTSPSLAQILDVASDVLNATIRLLALLSVTTSSTPGWLNVMFVVLGAYSFPLGFYQLTSRGRIKVSGQKQVCRERSSRRY